MKLQQTMSYPIARVLSLAILPAFFACQSPKNEEASEPESVGATEQAATPQSSPSLVRTVSPSNSNVLASGTPISTVLAAEHHTVSVGGYNLPPVQNDPHAVVEVTPAATGGHVIDLAICLDTSGSMDGLIDSAKQTLWSIVNDLALVEPAPKLRVALLTFGNDGHSAENGWVSVDLPLTADLDAISQKLFALTTNGGTEFVGRVVDAATRDLSWSTDPNALKLLVVAGNESADQDTVISFRDASKNAITAGIMVNSIYCGNAMDQLAPAWREVALLADGHFSSIDQDNGMVVIDTPFDVELSALTASVNGTYIPYGEEGAEGCSNQMAQDSNNGLLNNDAMAQRAQAKNSALYVCSWDLVDATKNKLVKIEDVDRKFLAEELKGLTNDELAAYVQKKSDERAKIQAQVAEVANKRQAWLAAERAKLNVDDSTALDRVMRDAIRAQAATKGLQFKEVIPAAGGGAAAPE